MAGGGGRGALTARTPLPSPMGIAGALAWGIVGFVFLVAAGFAGAHVPGGCVEANLLVWFGLAALAFSFAAMSLSFLTVPIAAFGILLGAVLLVVGGLSFLHDGGGCPLQFFGYAVSVP